MKRRISGILIAAVMIITTCLAGTQPAFADEYLSGDYQEGPYVWGDDAYDGSYDYTYDGTYDNTYGEYVQPDDAQAYGPIGPQSADSAIIEKNGVAYTSVKTAIAESQNGDVLKLTKDIVLAAPVLIEWTWEGTLTLDLNGHKIRMYGTDENVAVETDNSGSVDDGSGAVLVLYGGTLKVIDSAESDPYASSYGIIESTNDRAAVFRLVNREGVSTNLVIESGSFSNESYNQMPVIELMDEYGNSISAPDGEKLSVSLTGGYFNQEQPAEYIAPGYAQSVYNESWWVVQQSWETYYNVTFDSQAPDVASPAAQTVQEGYTATNPGDLYREGYNFEGWYDLNTGAWYDFDAPVYSNLNLGAWWTEKAPATYTVTFSSQAEDVPSPEAQTVQEGYTATNPGDLYREGYNFEGWYDLNTGAWYDFGAAVYSDLNLGAWWTEKTPDTYTVTFDPQTDEIYPPEPQTVEAGHTASDPGALWRDGYDFKGWFSDPEGAYLYYFDETPVNSDITIYAKWEASYQAISGGGGEYEKGSGEGIVFQINGDYSKFDSVLIDGLSVDPSNYYSWEGSTFVQLIPEYTDSLSFGKHDIEFVFTDGSCLTYFTVTEAAPAVYSVTFSFNGLKADPYLVVSVPSGSRVNIPPAPSGSDGYAFAGWFADSQCTTSFDFNAPILADTTIYANWRQEETTPEMFSVTFYTAHGLIPDGQLIQYGYQVLRPDDPWEQGYIFEGWYSDFEYQYAYDFNAPVYSNLTLYAKWSEQPTTIQYYTVSFYSERGTVPAAQTVESGHIAYRPQDPTADGFVFSGWFTDSAHQYPYDFNTPVTADIILYAGWAQLPSQNFIVSFNSNGHGDTPNPQTVKRGEAASRPADPYATGYTFSGWFTDEYCTAAYDFRSPVNADIVLYAKWIANTYTVRFDSNGGTGTMASQVYTYGTRAVLPANQFSRSGYYFTGWNTAADGTGQIIADRAEVINLTGQQGATVSLYAMWKNIYSVIEGAGSKVQRGTKTGLTFRIDGDYSKFNGIKVDGNVVAASAYTSWSGSTYVQLKPEYINQLTAETHTIRFMFTDGSVETRFEIVSGTPTTGDTSNSLIWIIIAIAALLIIAISVFVLIRRRREAAGAYYDNYRYNDRYDDRYDDDYDDEEYDDDDRY